MKSIQTMNDDEFYQHVKGACCMFAKKHFEKHNPNADHDTVWALVARHWREFTDIAIDWLSTCEADREAREAAPWN